MAREVTYQEDQAWYVPDIEDNREDNEPLRVLIAPMTAAEDRGISQRIYNFTKRKKKDDLMKIQALIVKIIRSRVLKVENYAITRVRGGINERIEINTGEDLAMWGEEAVITEVLNAIRESSTVEEGFLKNSDTPSDSCQAEIPPLDGNAAAAESVNSTLDELGIVSKSDR